MYQGKFEAEYRQKRLAEKEALRAAKLANAQATQVVPQIPVAEAPTAEPSVAETPVVEALNAAVAVADQPAAAPSAKVAKSQPVSPDAISKKKKTAKKSNRGNPTVTAVFYTFYFLIVIALCGGIFYINNWVHNYMIEYEAAQPTAKAQEAFDLLFADPDWGELYEKSGAKDTAYEGKEAYVAYMEELVGDSKLEHVKTSAGLSGGHKYYIQLDTQRLGHFILKNSKAGTTEIPDWQLDEVELYINREKSVMVQKLDGCTVHINGVAVDDHHTIQVSSTIAEEYLPSGTTGLRICTQKIDGLLSDPEITITDQNGESVEVTWNEEKGMYVQEYSSASMGPQEKERVLNAAETYSKFMIEEATRKQLGQYFLSNSEIYKTIIRMELWMQGNNGFNFTNQTVSEYTRYTDDLFSARVSLSLNVTRTNGTVKEYKLDTTLFFELQSDGTWMVFDMTNKDVQKEVSSVRLTFMDGDTELSSNFVASNATAISTPVLSVPNGQVFAGWYVKSTDENGKTVMNLMFTPDEDGNVTIPTGTTLEPMTLYPRFVAAS